GESGGARRRGNSAGERGGGRRAQRVAGSEVALRPARRLRLALERLVPRVKRPHGGDQGDALAAPARCVARGAVRSRVPHEVDHGPAPYPCKSARRKHAVLLSAALETTKAYP